MAATTQAVALVIKTTFQLLPDRLTLFPWGLGIVFSEELRPVTAILLAPAPCKVRRRALQLRVVIQVTAAAVAANTMGAALVDIAARAAKESFLPMGVAPQDRAAAVVVAQGILLLTATGAQAAAAAWVFWVRGLMGLAERRMETPQMAAAAVVAAPQAVSATLVL